MKRNSSIKKNIIYNIGYQVLSLIVPIITAPYISRVLGAGGMGLYSYTFSIAHYFVLLCMLGVLNYGNREIAMAKDKESISNKFWTIYSNQLFFGLLSIFLYFIFFFYYIHDDMLVYCLQALYILSGVLDISWFYFGIEKFKTTTSISAINKVLTTIFIFLLVKTAADVWLYTFIVAIGTLFNNVAYWLLLHKYVGKAKITKEEVLSHLKPLLLLFIPVIAINVYKYIDKIMLGSMINVDAVGIFDAAEKLTNIPMGFISAIGTVMLPRISNMLNSDDGNNIRKYNYLSFNLVIFLSVGMCFGLAGISDVFIPIFYGISFVESVKVLFVLCPCMIFVSWANVVRTQYLLPYKKDVLFCMSVTVGAIINIISNLILIPIYGAIGAAFSTLIAEFTVCIFQSIAANKDMKLVNPLVKVLPYLILGLLMYLTISNIKMSSILLCVVVRLFTGLLIYSLGSYFFIKKNFYAYSKYK